MVGNKPCTVFPRSILQPQNPKHNFDAGNKYHLAHVKTFLTYTTYVKVVFRVLAHVESAGSNKLYSTYSLEIFRILMNY
ncbi:hypothetical protein BpHYR1_015392 [Brachionus plicatilis]|uniref:Uncharacterized protein n=1 Tax=Brachionus plicatilis TaxID=10195 RepID=A0A3M7PK16_BRAPC|nr:hypothetical protein BpHYR1_015392 [Brachionus plicatilis]